MCAFFGQFALSEMAGCGCGIIILQRPCSHARAIAGSHDGSRQNKPLAVFHFSKQALHQPTTPERLIPIALFILLILFCAGVTAVPASRPLYNSLPAVLSAEQTAAKMLSMSHCRAAQQHLARCSPCSSSVRPCPTLAQTQGRRRSARQATLQMQSSDAEVR